MKKLLTTLIKYSIILGLPLFLAYECATWTNRLIFLPLNSKDPSTKIFEVQPKDTFKEIAQRLERDGLIIDNLTLTILARIKGIDKRVKAGEYLLSPSMSLLNILKIFDAGEILERKVTIPEGFTNNQIATLFQGAGIIKAELLLDMFENKEILNKADIPAENLEGYLFPDTYHFPKGTPAEEIVLKMIKRGNDLWPQDFSDRAEQLKMSRHEIITLASIVEKESGNFEEQPQIASVFHNRLAQNMKLQSDPTVIYGLKDFNGDITRADLENPHTFNTYIHQGLPPGPICNPGKSAIKATLFPANTQYLYFVSNNSGRHIFSENYDQHINAVNKYQKPK